MRDPTSVSDPDVKAITVFLASTATPERGGLPYLDAVLPAEDRLAATRVVRDLGTIPPDAILYSPNPSSTLPAITSCGTGTLRCGTRSASRLRAATSGRLRWPSTTVRPTRSPPPSFVPRGSRVGTPLPHGPARLRPPAGARPAALFRAAERRTRRLSAVEGHHRLIAIEEMPVTSSPEEIRTKLEAARLTIASGLRALAGEIETLPLEDAAEALSWFGTRSRGCCARLTASSVPRVAAARPDRPHRDDGAGPLRQALVEHGQARDAGSEVRLGDDRVTPVDRLGLMPRELHRHRPRHARASSPRVMLAS